MTVEVEVEARISIDTSILDQRIEKNLMINIKRIKIIKNTKKRMKADLQAQPVRKKKEMRRRIKIIKN